MDQAIGRQLVVDFNQHWIYNWAMLPRENDGATFLAEMTGGNPVTQVWPPVVAWSGADPRLIYEAHHFDVGLVTTLGSGLGLVPNDAVIVGAEVRVAASSNTDQVYIGVQLKPRKDVGEGWGLSTAKWENISITHPLVPTDEVTDSANVGTFGDANAYLYFGGEFDYWDDRRPNLEGLPTDPTGLLAANPDCPPATMVPATVNGVNEGTDTPDDFTVLVWAYNKATWHPYVYIWDVQIRFFYRIPGDTETFPAGTAFDPAPLRGITPVVVFQNVGGVTVPAHSVSGKRQVVVAFENSGDTGTVELTRVIGGVPYKMIFPHFENRGAVGFDLKRVRRPPLVFENNLTIPTPAFHVRRQARVAFATDLTLFTSEDDFYRIPPPGTVVFHTESDIDADLRRVGSGLVTFHNDGDIDAILQRYGVITSGIEAETHLAVTPVRARGISAVFADTLDSGIDLRAIRTITATFALDSDLGLTELSDANFNPADDDCTSRIAAVDPVMRVPAIDPVMRVPPC
jgi:hypothetical protein